MEQEELTWIQRARANWLKHGDRNTNFFHHYASSRRKNNNIKGLVDDNGIRHEDSNTMPSMVHDYFAHLFQTEPYEVNDDVLNVVKLKVTPEMNQGLLAPFSYDEVKHALFSIRDLKALGPDGLHAIFYKRFWHMSGDDLVQEVLQAVNSASVPDGWNDTTIVMIPKVDNPEKVAQLQPISLCNFVYKVISKMLATGMKGVMPNVISDQQSAFVPGRLIMDNILIAYEFVHAIKRKKGKPGLCAVKLDMHKAYDRVEWGFLEKMMLKLGFDDRWVKLIMANVSSVRYSVRFISMETEMITPTRGIRQGDPLSPYLFLIVAEGLSSLIQQAEERGELEGIKVCREAPMVSHLLFVDDSLILMHVDKSNADCLRGILDMYCQSSG